MSHLIQTKIDAIFVNQFSAVCCYVEFGLFGTLKLSLALQFIVTNAYFSVAQTLTLVLHATLK